MPSGLSHVTERFAHVQTHAVRLFERSEDFRELCEEYGACVEAAKGLEASGPQREPLRREYAALRLRLEGEILRYLKESSGP